MKQWLLDANKKTKTVDIIIKYIGEFLTFCQLELSNGGNPYILTTSHNSMDLMLYVTLNKRSFFEIYRQAMVQAKQAPSSVKKRIESLNFAITYLEVTNDQGNGGDFLSALSTTKTIGKK